MTENLGDRPAPQRSAPAGLLCPACRVDLVMSERQGIEIDYCPRCRGVWLDRGELDKILERSAADLAAPQAPPPEYRGEYERSYPRHDDDYKPYKHHKRRKSFLEELFD